MSLRIVAFIINWSMLMRLLVEACGSTVQYNFSLYNTTLYCTVNAVIWLADTDRNENIYVYILMYEVVHFIWYDLSCYHTTFLGLFLTRHSKIHENSHSCAESDKPYYSLAWVWGCVGQFQRANDLLISLVTPSPYVKLWSSCVIPGACVAISNMNYESSTWTKQKT